MRTVETGETFSITVITDDDNDLFIAGGFIPEIISNVKTEVFNGKRNYEFLAVNSGITDIFIDRLRDNNLTKAFIHYRITVNAQQEKKTILKKAAEQKVKTETIRQNEEDTMFRLVVSLFEDKIYDKAAAAADAYLSAFPAGIHTTAARIKKSEIFTLNNDFVKAEQILREYQEKSPSLSRETQALLYNRRADLLTQTANTNTAAELYLRTIHGFKDCTNFFSALSGIGTMYSKFGHYDTALKYLEMFYSLQKNSKDYHLVPGFDSVLFLIAEAYEKAAEKKSASTAVFFYNEILNRCPFSPLVPAAQKRLRYLEHHFLKVR